jgi:hypothetical protein
MHRALTLFFVSTWLVVTTAGPVLSRSTILEVPVSNLSVHENARGTSYVVQFDLPEDLHGKRLDSVFLDFVVDASPTDETEADAAPLISAFPLTSSSAGGTLEYEGDGPTSRPVAMRGNQNVRIDITQIVAGWLAAPSGNHGIVIGTLSGPSVGTISLRSTAMNGFALRLTFFYQDRSGERMSTR